MREVWGVKNVMLATTPCCEYRVFSFSLQKCELSLKAVAKRMILFRSCCGACPLLADHALSTLDSREITAFSRGCGRGTCHLQWAHFFLLYHWFWRLKGWGSNFSTWTIPRGWDLLTGCLLGWLFRYLRVQWKCASECQLQRSNSGREVCFSLLVVGFPEAADSSVGNRMLS